MDNSWTRFFVNQDEDKAEKKRIALQESGYRAKTSKNKDGTYDVYGKQYQPRERRDEY